MVSRTISRTGARALTTTAMACVLAASAAGAAHAFNRVAWLWAYDPNATATYTVTGDYTYVSTGGTVTIKPLGTGEYEVNISKIDSGYTDNVQISAYDTSGYCVSGGWFKAATTVEAYVYCYDANGNAANTYFSLLYQSRSAPLGAEGRGIAFLWANGPTSASYTPASGYNYNSTGATNTITRSSTGVYVVNVPNLSYEGDVQVTAYGGPSRCKVTGWGEALRASPSAWPASTRMATRRTSISTWPTPRVKLSATPRGPTRLGRTRGRTSRPTRTATSPLQPISMTP